MLLLRSVCISIMVFTIILIDFSSGIAETFCCTSTFSADTSSIHVRITTAAKITNTQSTTGHRNAVAIFATFADSVPEGTAVPSYASSLFDPDHLGSFTHFYRAMSFGRLTFHGITLPTIYTSDHPSSSYGPGEYDRFVLEILQKADPDVDFSHFDNDGPDGIPNSGDDDGYVDVVFINLLPDVPGGFIHNKATGTGNLGILDDFITDDPSVGGGQIKIRGNGGTTQIVRNFAHAVGAMAHEYGHLLGLPDLYDTSSSSTPDEPPELDSAGIGAWSLMGRGNLGWNGDDGPNPFSAWEREQLGWANVVTVTNEMRDVVIDDVETGGIIYKIPVTDYEYFLIENRQRSGGYYDRNIPGEGLLIWHINLSGNNDTEERKRVDLECADGLFTDAGFPIGKAPDPIKGGDNLDFWAHDDAYTKLHTGNLGDATDPFDGLRFTEFSLATNPGSQDEAGYWRNGTSGIAVRNIHRSGSQMIADLRPNTWSGHITSDVIWSGIITVTGDIVVDHSGSLLILPGTVIEVNSSDDRHEGNDPSRIEFIILGHLTVNGNDNAPVRFTSSTGGSADWYGIAIDPGVSIRLNGLRVEGAVSGVSWIGGTERIAIQEASFFDTDVVLPFTPELSVRGNGDRKVNPGELIAISPKIQNLTFRTFSSLSVRVWSPDSRVRFYGQREAVRSFGSGIGPGDIVILPIQLRMLVPSDPLGGMVYPILFDITADGEVWCDTLKVTVEGTDRIPPLISHLTVTPSFAPVGHPVTIEADILEGGTVSIAEAEISHVDGGTVVGHVPLSPSGDGTFSGTWTPPFPASFTISLQIADNAGNVERTERAKFFTSLPFGKSSNLLLIEDNSTMMDDLLRKLHLPYDLWNIDERGPINASVMASYGDRTGGIVIWNARLEPSDIPTIGSYLDSGGRLLITGEGIGYDLQLSWPEGAKQFLMDRLHISVAGVEGIRNLTSPTITSVITGISPFIAREAFAFFDSCRCGSGNTKTTPAGRFVTTLASSGIGRGFTFLKVLPNLLCTCGCGGLVQTDAAFADLITVYPPAVPIIFDQEGRPVAISVEGSSSKAVYLGFRLSSIADRMQATTLLSDIFNYLRSSNPTAINEATISFPDRYTLSQNIPNPFNAATTITYHVPAISATLSPYREKKGQGDLLFFSPSPLPSGGVAARIGVWDMTGRLVRVLVDELQSPGEYRIVWDGKDERGRPVSSGVYIYRLEINGRAVTETRRMVLVK